ncbi:hypothetical protein Lepto7375DRAFT_7303 [Leptolyngbya sp. PCC 7375]|nr:hypothetical protein Lepto7375DRAFT_7303 [Leptolyngbya sp. PCC 7375]
MKSKLTALVVAIATSLSPSIALAQIESPTISGEILVIDPYYGYPGEPCNQRRRGYQDIMQGFSIPVKDGSGNILAVIDVPPGVNEDTGTETDGEQSFVFCVVSIPETQLPYSDFYVFDLGRRGEIVNSYQQLEEDNWQLVLSVGGNR